MGLGWSTAVLRLIVLLVAFRKLLANPHSLDFSFNVRSRYGHGHPWCVVRGSVVQQSFLQYDSGSNRATPLSPLGENVQNTKVWTEMSKDLSEMCQKFRELLLDCPQEKHTTRGLLTLQANLSCHHGESTNGFSWEFSINGQTATLTDTMSMIWTHPGPEASKFQEQWEKNQELRDKIQFFSGADCVHFLKTFSTSWKEMLASTATPSKDSVTHHSSSSNACTVGISLGKIMLVLTCSILTILLLDILK